jgi:hypothetical protein
MSRGTTRREVTITGNVATVRTRGSSHIDTARVLGTIERAGEVRVYLDALLHRDGDDWGEWEAAGAVTTVLSRPATTQQQGAN